MSAAESSHRGGVRVAHITTAHDATDVRIFEKEARALADAGYDVHLLVPDGPAEERKGGVTIHGFGASRGRLRRMLFAPPLALRAARRLGAEVCHLHDPELIPVGFALRLLGVRVVYDAHEDLSLQVMAKQWIPGPLRGAASRFAQVLQWAAGRWLNAVVAATPAVADGFRSGQTTVVFNYPRLEEFERSGAEPKGTVAYVGAISPTRGIGEMVEAVGSLNGGHDHRLVIAGELQIEDEAWRSLSAQQHVDYRGILDRQGVAGVLASAAVGLVVLHPLPNYLESYPVKLFEYMAAGLPVVASDFPLWRSIVLEAECGVVVDPLDPGAVAEAIAGLLADPARAAEMGRRGRAAAEASYNWGLEGQKLVDLYDRLTHSVK